MMTSIELLQWGRVHGTRKRGRAEHRTSTTESSFNGAAFMERGKVPPRSLTYHYARSFNGAAFMERGKAGMISLDLRARFCELQWGRVHGTRKSDHDVNRHMYVIAASMGPRSWNAEKLSLLDRH